VDIEVFGETEGEVVAAALSQWTSEGAEIVEVPAIESWVAALDGRDVAVALPEQNGPDDWIVHDLQTCAPGSSGPAPINGELDCTDEYIWTEQGSLDPDTVGYLLAEDALRTALNDFLRNRNAEIQIVSDSVGSLVVDSREVVVALAVEAAAGGWLVDTIKACRGYER